MTGLPGMVDPVTEEQKSPGALPAGGKRLRLVELRGDLPALCAVIFLMFVVLGAIFGPMLLPDASAPSLSERLTPPAWVEGGSWSHIFGTDPLGRDLLSRLASGARVTLLIGTAVVLLAGSFGTAMGIIAGYFGGWRDLVIMRWVDTQVAFPGLLLTLTVLAVVGPSLGILIVVLALSGWMVYARVTQAIVKGIKQKAYVQAAETVGCSPLRIMSRYILPNLASSLITLGTLEFANVVLVESSLSYLGYGIQPPDSSWGLMVAEGQQYITVAWWTITFPGLFIALTVLSLNIAANWVRSVSDPEIREKLEAVRQGS